MNDHLLFLSAAYALTVVCMAWEVVALRLRRRKALRQIRDTLEESS
jgi:heme exporter protein CcmD